MASFTLENLDGIPTPRYSYEYHENTLKLFVPRTGHLRQPDDLVVPLRQRLRRRKRKLGGPPS